MHKPSRADVDASPDIEDFDRTFVAEVGVEVVSQARKHTPGEVDAGVAYLEASLAVVRIDFVACTSHTVHFGDVETETSSGAVADFGAHSGHRRQSPGQYAVYVTLNVHCIVCCF